MRYFSAAVLGFVGFIISLHWGSPYLVPQLPDVAWIAELYKRKEAAGIATPPPRIIVVGGSEAHYGISAEMIDDAMSIPTLNFGTHAGLGWNVLMRKVEPLLKEGDIVLWSLNRYSLWRSDPNPVMARYIQQAQPSMLFAFSLRQWPELLSRDLLHQVIRLSFLAANRAAARERAARITQYGDEVRNQVATKEMQATLRSSARRKPAYIRPIEKITKPLKRLFSFAERMEAKGVRVFAFWPGTLETVDARSASSRGVYRQWNEILEVNGIAVLNTADEYLLPPEQMFDTADHPAVEGRAEITNMLVGALNEQL